MPDIMQLIEDWKGYTSVNERGRPTDAQAAAFYDLLGNVRHLPAHRHEYEIREAMTTDSFPLMFADVIDRQMLAGYAAIDPVWKKYMRIKDTCPVEFRFANPPKAGFNRVKKTQPQFFGSQQDR